jgi:hypothetical protein
MHMKLLTALFITCILAVSCFAADQETVSVAGTAEKALQHSQITFPGSRPFHLTATITETTDPNSDYRAKIEEYWVSPTKWRRAIESPGFSQIRVVNSDAVFEKNTGDYFPVWLNQMLTALFDPLPMLSILKQGNAQMQKLGRGTNSTACADFHARIDRWVICFEGSSGLLSSVFTKGYSAECKDYAKFGDKRVARRIVDDPEPGMTLETRISSLDDLTSPDEGAF